MATAPTLTQIQQGGVPATVSDIVSAIQGQYTGVPMPTGGTSYGAARFLGSSPISGGTGTPTGTVAGVVPSWFAPGAFDINAFKAAPNLPQLNEQIATGTVYSGGSDSSSREPNTVSGDIYSSLFNPMPSWLPTVAGLFVPGAGILLNAAEGYAQNQASEALKSALTAYGVENMPEASNPVWSAILGVFNKDTDATKFAKSLAQSFQTPESLFGYYDASVNSSVSPIVNHILNESRANVSANQLGYLGNAVAGYVQGEIASGKNLNDAFLSVAQQFGMNPQDAAAYAVNAVIDAAAKDTIYGVPVDEAAKQLASDPLGLFISNLGLLGVDTKALEVQAGLRPSDTEQALMDQIAALESGFANQLNVQGEQFQTLLNQYQEAGLSADQALQQTINDLSSNLGAQINTQSEQFQTLLNQYKEFGMTENEALRQTISDMQSGLTGQINTQSEQFQTLLNQYQQVGLTADAALRQTIADMQTGLTNQINTQGQQFQTLLNQYQELGMTADQALRQTIADMLSNQNAINNDLLSRINEGFNTDPGIATPTPVPTPELATPTPLPPATGGSGGDYGNVGFGTDPGTATTSPVADNAPQPGTPLGPATGDSGGGGYSDSGVSAPGDSGWGSDIGRDGDDGYSGSSDSGGGGGSSGGSSRYCCSRMVHHGLWDVNHEFARLTVWSRKQPRWWRSGYPVWGKIVAKHLLGKVGFWTDVMQAFYDNKVRHKPRTWKSTLGELVIFPGAFVCGMIWREVPQGARLADPKEFA